MRPANVGVVDQILSVGVERVVRERRGEGLRALPKGTCRVWGGWPRVGTQPGRDRLSVRRVLGRIAP